MREYTGKINITFINKNTFLEFIKIINSMIYLCFSVA